MEGEYIIGIYDYFDSSRVKTPSYYFVYLFDREGRLDMDSFEDTFSDVLLKSMKSEIPGYIGPFENLSELNQYAYGLCEKTSSEWIGLMPIKDYNQVMTGVSSVEEFRLQFAEKLNILENVNKGSKSKGILSRFF